MGKRLAILSGILVISAIGFMTIEARGNWGFVLPFRGKKLAALVLVAVAVSSATVLFQTITRNRILTPSIMGFDALYLLIVTSAVFFLGPQGYVALSDFALFAITLCTLIIAGLLLFGTLLRQPRQDLMRMILTGLILGVMFRSFKGLISRMIDPNEYAMVQVASYARFNRIETDLLAVSTVLTVIVLAFAWPMRHRLDVIALGHDAATNLGEDPRKGQLQCLVLIAVLVAVSTALVGPVAFLGLLVVSLARIAVPSARHAVLLPAAGIISAIVLVAGQTLLERVLDLTTPLSVVIDFAGGLFFLILVLRGNAK